MIRIIQEVKIQNKKKCSENACHMNEHLWREKISGDGPLNINKPFK